MKNLLLASVVTLAGFAALGSASYADINEAMKDSKYCRNTSSDPLCMGPETMAQRTTMLEMTKEKAMESRTKYCTDNSSASDPICDSKMMNDTTGY